MSTEDPTVFMPSSNGNAQNLGISGGGDTGRTPIPSDQPAPAPLSAFTNPSAYANPPAFANPPPVPHSAFASPPSAPLSAFVNGLDKSGGGGGKKAVHVKWAGKTIALGTFPQAEADEKCARAKALTRAWRSTMRPKPSREWVMLELERLQVRVVSGRLGRRGSGSSEEDEDDEEDGDDGDDKKEKKLRKKSKSMKKLESKESAKKKAKRSEGDPEKNNLPQDSPGAGTFRSAERRNSFVARRGSSALTGSLLSAAHMARANSLELGSSDFMPDDLHSSLANLDNNDGGAPRRSSNSVGNKPTDRRNSRRSSLIAMAEAAAAAELGQVSGNNSGSPEPGIPPHRTLVGGGSAAAYEAARADHYRNVAAQQQSKDNNKDKSAESNGFNFNDNLQEGDTSLTGGPISSNLSSGLGIGSGGGTGGLAGAPGLLGSGSSSGIPQLGLSVNPNQHYEMLKLHHMNLLNEIQETTLMMNLYQQQQLQQQQQQQYQQQMSGDQNLSDQSLALQLAQQGQGVSSPLFDSIYGMGGSGSMGTSQQFASLQSGLQQSLQQQSQQQRGLGLGGSGTGSASNQMQALLRQQNFLSGGIGLDTGMQRRLSLTQQSTFVPPSQDQGLSLEEQEELCQSRLQKLKQDIADRQRRSEASDDTNSSGAKRRLSSDSGYNKRPKS